MTFGIQILLQLTQHIFVSKNAPGRLTNHDSYRKCIPEALKSLYRSPGYKKKQLVLCKNYVLQW